MLRWQGSIACKRDGAAAMRRPMRCYLVLEIQENMRGEVLQRGLSAASRTGPGTRSVSQRSIKGNSIIDSRMMGLPHLGL
jgi:hypothetical protein